MRQFLKQFLSAGAASASLLLAATPAHAVYNIVMTESGGNVVANASGSINIAGVSTSASGATCAGGLGFISPSTPTLCMGTGGTSSIFSASISPPNFGPGPGGSAVGTSSSGQPVFLQFSNIYLPPGYTSGAALSSTATWAGKTLATLGVTVGTYTWTFGTGANADSVVLYAGTSPPSAAAPVTPPPIPENVGLPAVPGFVSQLGVLNLLSGSGPSMTTCLLGTVKQIFGAPATYLGQLPNGAAQIAVGGQTLSFYPVSASTSTARGIGAFPGSDNSLTVGTSCGTFTVVPAMEDLADLGAALSAMGVSAQIDANGIMTAEVNGQLYVVRPDYVVSAGPASGTASLQVGSDGMLRLTDRAGHVQILRPAFLNPAVLQAAMGVALGGTLVIETDGSGVFSRIDGTQLTLTPEMVLTPAPQGLRSANFVNDRPGHYQYRIGTYYQGFTVTAR